MSETRSILVAEVIGETPLLNKIGATETERAVERCRNRAERSIESNDGDTDQTEGRCLVAHFKRCENAILAAFDMQSRVSQLPPVSGVSLSVRIAVHFAASNADGVPDAQAIETTKAIAGDAPESQILISAEALANLPDSLQPHIDTSAARSVSGYKLPVYPFKPGTSLAPLREAFSPTATSLALQSMLSDLGPLSQPPVAVASSATPRASLMLRHENHNFVVSDLRPVLLAGREDGNDLVIADKRASRHHARVEWRQNRFVLIDTSTNGTYLANDQGTEVILRRSEADLPPRGRIGFGYSPLEADAEIVFFDVGQR